MTYPEIYDIPAITVDYDVICSQLNGHAGYISQV